MRVKLHVACTRLDFSSWTSAIAHPSALGDLSAIAQPSAFGDLKAYKHLHCSGLGQGYAHANLIHQVEADSPLNTGPGDTRYATPSFR